MIIRKLTLTCLLLFCICLYTLAQDLRINKIEPPNWWVGMKWNKVQLMVYGENLNNITAGFNDPAIKVIKVNEVENSSYTFIDIEVPSRLNPGSYDLILSRNRTSTKVPYEFLQRTLSANIHRGFGVDDAIYLVMPDRFVNGDAMNDSVDGYFDEMQHLPKQQRKGGDIQGLIDKLDYIKDMGFTTIWSTPLTENNTFRSYHGYATTNHYKVDPRLGTNELYKTFVYEAHKRDLKVILDHVANHISDDHPWMNNLPTQDWINGTIDNHTPANHNKMIYTDPHSHPSLIEEVYTGWFVSTMPDLNQRNPFVANHIIQNTLWWMEYAGIDGIREDTYPYAEPKFMAKWAEAVLNEYPNSSIVGEVWTGESAFLAAYQGNPKVHAYVDSKLPSLTDFGLRDQFVAYLQGRKGLYDIFNVIAKDHLFSDPYNLVTFVDNHDVGRGMYFADTNMAKMKMVYHMLMTLRGIPQIFYGSEIGMVENEDHGTLRKIFPGGGWASDTRDAFTSEGRTDYENEVFDYLKQLLHLRKDYEVIRRGKLTHFPIHDNVYVYFKSLGEERVINLINDNDEERKIDLRRYSVMMQDASKMKNLKSGNEVSTDVITVPAKSASIFRILQ